MSEAWHGARSLTDRVLLGAWLPFQTLLSPCSEPALPMCRVLLYGCAFAQAVPPTEALLPLPLSLHMCPGSSDLGFKGLACREHQRFSSQIDRPWDRQNDSA